jgi:3D (Asp-Asp-Asp) domain-containing protein
MRAWGTRLLAACLLSLVFLLRPISVAAEAPPDAGVRLALDSSPPASMIAVKARCLEMIATAYSMPGQYTYSGLIFQRGVVAIDPRVVPLWTRLYIDGYWEALAADTGGDILGWRIDLAMDTISEAVRFGVQPVAVFILPN